MVLEALFYLELLGFLAGTLLYGFLLRAVLRRPDVLAGNWAFRAALACLTLWFAVTLVDHYIFMLLGARHRTTLGAITDLTRAAAWLLAFPLIAHVFERALALGWGFRRLAPVAWLGYLPMILVIPAAARFAVSGSTRLAEATRPVFAWAALHAAIGSTLAVVASGLLARRLRGRRLGTFVRGQQVVFAIFLAVIALSVGLDPWSRDATWAARAVRTFLLLGLLLPGMLLATFVRRANLLRLSLSFRTVRHFSVALLAVAGVLVGAWVVGERDLASLRRFMAVGLLLGLTIGVAATPVLERLLGRSATLRKVLGRGVSARDLAALTGRIQAPGLDEDAAVARAAEVLGDWLGTRATFVRARPDDPDLGRLWAHLEATGGERIARLDPPDGDMARRLARLDLHAAFALRLDGALEGVLLLPVSAAGGGYADGQLAAVGLLVEQLAVTLALRRLARSRIDEERRQEGQERLALLGLVTASLAHEVGNPLSAIKSLAQSLREDLADGRLEAADGVADLDAIVGQVDRLTVTSREILGVARPARDDRTELAALVRSTLYVLGSEARRRGVELEGARVEEVGALDGSEAAWQTVVFNLVLNAIQHTEGGARVTIRLEHRRDRVAFTIANPHPPCSDDEIARLFEPFVSEGGTGLGLPLVARRVRELGGQVDVRHEGGCLVFEVSVAMPPASGASA